MKEKSQSPSRRRTERLGKCGKAVGMSISFDDENEKVDKDRRHAQKIGRNMETEKIFIFMKVENGWKYFYLGNLKTMKAKMPVLMRTMAQKTNWNESFAFLWRMTTCAIMAPGQPQSSSQMWSVASGMRH